MKQNPPLVLSRCYIVSSYIRPFDNLYHNLISVDANNQYQLILLFFKDSIQIVYDVSTTPKAKKQIPPVLTNHQYLRPCQGILVYPYSVFHIHSFALEVTGFEPATSASRTQRSTPEPHLDFLLHFLISWCYIKTSNKIILLLFTKYFNPKFMYRQIPYICFVVTLVITNI